jgi:hypothetical protein
VGGHGDEPVTRREPLGARALATLVTVLILALAVLSGLTWLRTHAPHAETRVDLPEPSAIHGAVVPLLGCEGPLPEGDVELEAGGGTAGLARSAAVVDCPSVFDPAGDGGPVVDVLGEVVGDVLPRREGTWLQVNDDAYALELGPLGAHGQVSGMNSGLAVWVPDEVVLAEGGGAGALTPGRPRLRGDIVLVRGRVHRSDGLDGGGLTLRAEQLELIVAAEPAEPPLHVAQGGAAAAAVTVAGGLVLWSRRRERRR